MLKIHRPLSIKLKHQIIITERANRAARQFQQQWEGNRNWNKRKLPKRPATEQRHLQRQKWRWVVVIVRFARLVSGKRVRRWRTKEEKQKRHQRAQGRVRWRKRAFELPGPERIFRQSAHTGGEPKILPVQGRQRGQRAPLHVEEPLQRADGDRGRDDTVVKRMVRISCQVWRDARWRHNLLLRVCARWNAFLYSRENFLCCEIICFSVNSWLLFL